MILVISFLCLRYWWNLCAGDSLIRTIILGVLWSRCNGVSLWRLCRYDRIAIRLITSSGLLEWLMFCFCIFLIFTTFGDDEKDPNLNLVHLKRLLMGYPPKQSQLTVFFAYLQTVLNLEYLSILLNQHRLRIPEFFITAYFC